MKITKTKANFLEHGLNLATYLDTNFAFLKSNKIDLSAKNVLTKSVQAYLDKNEDRKEENRLLGIIGIHDGFRNHTGGRIHLIAGVQGPLVEAIQTDVLSHPIDYEAKYKILLKAVQSVSTITPPKAGNIHFHLFHCIDSEVSPFTLLEFIRKEHGFQNALQQIAPSSFYVLINTGSNTYWRPNVNREMIHSLFSS